MAASITFRLYTLSRCYSFPTKLLNEMTLCRPLSRALSNDTKDLNTSNTEGGERDPFPIFAEERVQSLLKRVTGFNALKIAGPQKKPLQKPIYKLLTDHELAEEQRQAHEILKDRLQIPPFMAPRKPVLTPLAVDPDLADFDTSKYVFVDITFGVKDRKRHVVIRETDGTLKVAPWDVKDRMNQIYNPTDGRSIIKPQMFNEEHLERLISQKKYAYVLDNACCQFEPDDPEYIRTTHRVFKAIDTNRDYHLLWSTRHYGSLVFYLTWTNAIDFLLIDTLNRDLLSDACDLVRLYSILHPDSECAQLLQQVEEADSWSVVKAFVETNCTEKAQLELCVQSLQDSRKTPRQLPDLTAS